MGPPISILFFVSAVYGCYLEDGRSAVYLSVFEDLKPGEVIGRLPVKGNVSGENADVHLRIVRGGDIVGLSKDFKNLVLKKPLDRDEGAGKLETTVECKMDGQTDLSQLNISVFITIKDVNDNAPVFDQSEYKVAISEELPIGTIVFTDFEAEDKDQSGPNSLVHYSILPGTFSEYLDIPDAYRPIITIKKRINYEELQSFSAQIEARDQGAPPRASIAVLKVTVKDEDDLDPFFTYSYYDAKEIENGQLVVLPEPIHAADGDALNEKISYELAGELSDHFSIDSFGVIRIRSNPPPQVATVFVIARQANNWERNATAILQIDLAPTLQFEFEHYSAQIKNDAPANFLITQVKAFTRNEKSIIKYSINESDALVTIDEKYGKILYKGPTKMKSGKVSYGISATDGKQVSRTRLTLVINGEAVCQKGPKFEHDHYEMQMGLPMLGEVALIQRSPGTLIRLLNMNRYFSLDDNGRLHVAPGPPPPCDLCELILAASDKEGRVAVTKVSVHNLSTPFSATSLLSLLILVAVVLLMMLLLLFICRKMSYTWSMDGPGCWRSSSSDTGCVISGGTASPHRYVVNTEDKQVHKPRPPSGNSDTGRSPQPYRSQGAHLVPVTVGTREGAPTVYF